MTYEEYKKAVYNTGMLLTVSKKDFKRLYDEYVLIRVIEGDYKRGKSVEDSAGYLCYLAEIQSKKTMTYEEYRDAVYKECLKGWDDKEQLTEGFKEYELSGSLKRSYEKNRSVKACADWILFQL